MTEVQPSERRESQAHQAEPSVAEETAGLEALDLIEQGIDPTLDRIAGGAGGAFAQAFGALRFPRLSSEGVLWFVGVLLVLAGSLYFTQSNWSGWSERERVSIVTGGLVAYEALFIALSLVLARRPKTPILPQRVLAGIGLLLAPVVAIAVAIGIAQKGPLGILIAGASCAVLLSGLAAKPFDAALRGPIIALNALATLSIGFSARGGAGALLFLVTFLLLFAMSFIAVMAAKRHPALVLGHLAYLSAVVVFARMALGPAHPPPSYPAPALALAALTAHRAAGTASHRLASVLVIAFAGVAMPLALSAPLGAIDARVVVLLTALLSTWALAARGVVDDTRVAFAMAIGCGLFAYFFIPAPFDALLSLLLSSAKQALGYTEAPLPVAFYGLTFVPYLIALWIALRTLDDRGRDRLAGVTGAALLVIAVGLITLAFTETRDGRPVLFALPIYGIGFWIQSRRPGYRWLEHLALAAIPAWLCRLAFSLELDSALAIGLAAAGLALALVAAWTRDEEDRTRVLWHALASAGLAGVVAIAARFVVDGGGAFALRFAALGGSALGLAAVAIARRSLRPALFASIALGVPLAFFDPPATVGSVLALCAVVLAIGGAQARSLDARSAASVVAASAGLLLLWTGHPSALQFLPLALILIAAPLVSERGYRSRAATQRPLRGVRAQTRRTSSRSAEPEGTGLGFGSGPGQVVAADANHPMNGESAGLGFGSGPGQVVAAVANHPMNGESAGLGFGSGPGQVVAAVANHPMDGEGIGLEFGPGTQRSAPGWWALGSVSAFAVELALAGRDAWGWPLSAGAASAAILAVIGARIIDRLLDRAELARALRWGSAALAAVTAAWMVFGFGPGEAWLSGTAALYAGATLMLFAFAASGAQALLLFALALCGLGLGADLESALSPIARAEDLVAWIGLGEALLFTMAGAFLSARPRVAARGAEHIGDACRGAEHIRDARSGAEHIGDARSGAAEGRPQAGPAACAKSDREGFEEHWTHCTDFGGSLLRRPPSARVPFGLALFLLALLCAAAIASLLCHVPVRFEHILLAIAMPAVAAVARAAVRFEHILPAIATPAVTAVARAAVRIDSFGAEILLWTSSAIAAAVVWTALGGPGSISAAFALGGLAVLALALAGRAMAVDPLHRLACRAAHRGGGPGSGRRDRSLAGVNGVAGEREVAGPPSGGYCAVEEIVAWSFIAGGIFVSELSTRGAGAPIALWAAAIAALLFHRRRPSALTLAGAVLAFLAAISWTWFAIGRALDTGRPELAILPFLSTGPLAIGLALSFHARRRIDPALARCSDIIALVLMLFATLLASAAIALISDPPILDRAVTELVLVGALVHWVRAAQRTDRARYAFLAEVALGLAWLEVRRRSTFVASIPNVDAYTMILAAFVFTGIHAIARRGGARTAFERVSRITAMVLPMLAVIAIPKERSWTTVQLAMLTSAAYAVIARAGLSRFGGPLATILLNIGLFIAWSKAGVSDPQLYAVPIGASLLFLGHLYRDALSERATSVLRLVALGGVYLTSFVSVLAFEVPVHALIMACVSVGGCLFGVVLRIRSYLYLGAGFLVLDLATSIVRFGLAGQTQTTIVLTALGLTILSAMVLFSLHREAIVEKARALAGEFEAWRA